MGVGPGLWKHFSAVKTEEDLSFLKEKTLAIDLSYWLVQQQEAVKGKRVRKPHLRLTFFRVIKLVARVGARPLFVVDGKPPPLKKAIQEKRSRQSSFACRDFESERENSSQSSYKDKVEECVVMLKYLGIPVIRAEGEAESLCAELDRKDLVNFCVTPDSDAFVHGAKRVIKHLQADPKNPLVELYQAIDIKDRLRLHQRHLLALALLVGCDYTEGVPGVGLKSALRLVECFSEDEILDRLRAWGKGELPTGANFIEPCHADEDNQQIKYTHCSKCGHLGTIRDHRKLGCQTCNECTGEDWNDIDLAILGCNEKSKGYKCTCHACKEKANQDEKTRSRAWWMKICGKMAATPGFPNEDIIDLFLKPDMTIPQDLESLSSMMAMERPNMKQLETFLKEKLGWKPSFVRFKTLPLLSHFCLVELASGSSGSENHDQSKGLINDLYRPVHIEGVKVDHSEKLYVLNWGTVNSTEADAAEQWLGTEPSQIPKLKRLQNISSTNVERQSCEKKLDCLSSSWSFVTHENPDLVKAACPELAKAYDEAQAAKKKNFTKKVKRKRVEAVGSNGKQSSISSYDGLVHSSNMEAENKPEEAVPSEFTLDIPGATSPTCDIIDESHAFFTLAANGEIQESGLATLTTASPMLGSPKKLPRREGVSRKLIFSERISSYQGGAQLS